MSKRKTRTYDPQHEAEMLNSPVRMDGVGEDQVVKDLLSEEFVHMPDPQAGQIAMALAELLTGQKMQARQQEILMERFTRIEKAQKAWEEDKQKFLEEVDKRAASLIVTNPLEKDKMQAQWAATAKEAQEMAAAQMVTNKLMFEQRLKEEPKEIITSPGILEVHRHGDELVPELVAEVISIKDVKYVLRPGVPTEVPQTFANRYRERQKELAMIRERQNLMRDGVTEANQVVEKWQEISNKYKVGGDVMPHVEV